ncbi:hypothetical protein [Kribbella ginsengisoli]
MATGPGVVLAHTGTTPHRAHTRYAGTPGQPTSRDRPPYVTMRR